MENFEKIKEDDCNIYLSFDADSDDDGITSSGDLQFNIPSQGNQLDKRVIEASIKLITQHRQNLKNAQLRKEGKERAQKMLEARKLELENLIKRLRDGEITDEDFQKIATALHNDMGRA